MFSKPSIFMRLFAGKSTGLVIGLVGLVLLPQVFPGAGWDLRVAILFWYTTMGAMVALVGVITRCPVTGLSLRWWLRGPAIGAWMNLVLALFMHQTLAAMLANPGWGWMQGLSPWWIIAEGALVGLACDFMATRFGGEGKDTVTGLKS